MSRVFLSSYLVKLPRDPLKITEVAINNLSSAPDTASDESLEAGVLEVKEVSEGGSVPDLRITNTSPKMILILDGEVSPRAWPSRRSMKKKDPAWKSM
jgi:hypothetical protein